MARCVLLLVPVRAVLLAGLAPGAAAAPEPASLPEVFPTPRSMQRSGVRDVVVARRAQRPPRAPVADRLDRPQHGRARGLRTPRGPDAVGVGGATRRGGVEPRDRPRRARR